MELYVKMIYMSTYGLGMYIYRIYNWRGYEKPVVALTATGLRQPRRIAQIIGSTLILATPPQSERRNRYELAYPKQLMAIQLLVEGNSIRSTERITRGVAV